jgi:hypothetical protein
MSQVTIFTVFSDACQMFPLLDIQVLLEKITDIRRVGTLQ